MSKTKIITIAAILAVLTILGTCQAATNPTTKINNLNPQSGITGTVFSVALQGTISTSNGDFLIYLTDNADNLVTLLVNKTASGNNVNENFAMPSVIPGSYKIVLQDINTTTTDAKTIHITSTNTQSEFDFRMMQFAIVAAIFFAVAIAAAGIFYVRRRRGLKIPEQR
jgi:sensor c-di-GMP phosphodiesterase-like protein